MHLKKRENYGLFVVHGYMCASVVFFVTNDGHQVDAQELPWVSGGDVEAAAEGTCPPSLKPFFFFF